MKRIRLLILLCAFAVTLPISLATAGASGSSGESSASIKIQSAAQYNDAGFFLQVGTWARCSGGSGLGLVQVHVYQGPPQTTTPTNGFGGEDVVCNGSWQEVPVTVEGVRFGGGPATATATLTVLPDGKSATATKTITITAQRT